MHTPRIAFGLGSNMNDRANYLHDAAERLKYLPFLNSDTMRLSPIIETPALLPENAPASWDIPYLNAVAVAHFLHHTPPDPESVLMLTQEIEKQMGRQMRGRWGPREIDIDIVTIEGLTWQSPSLTIPHPDAHLRWFVIAPLHALWEDAPLAKGFFANTTAFSQHSVTWWQP
jgi:2-amino-4-hydroxy-6-hydroxymethyldihydropteridine diphosphokinase